MKIIEAIDRLDALNFNTYTDDDKVEWLSRLDNMVKKQIIDNHDGAEQITFSGYTPDTPTDTVLLVPAPYDEVYIRWMEAQIHYHNGEYDKYNNAIIMFNTQTHLPVRRGRRFLF